MHCMRRISVNDRHIGTIIKFSYTLASMSLSVILPCYNEEENIAAAVHDVDSWFKAAGIDGTIIVVNDGSKDGSADILDALSKKMPHLTIVTHQKNGGYGVAVRSGCDAATTDLIAFMDSDGQFHASDLGLLLVHMDTYAFVTGRRAHRADPLIRNIFGKILGGMNYVVLGLWVRDVNCGLKMFRREVWKDIRPTHGVEKLFNTEMFLRLKRKGIVWQTVDVPHYPRTKGTPTGGSVKVIIRMFKELWGLRTAKL